MEYFGDAPLRRPEQHGPLRFDKAFVNADRGRLAQGTLGDANMAAAVEIGPRPLRANRERPDTMDHAREPVLECPDESRVSRSRARSRRRSTAPSAQHATLDPDVQPLPSPSDPFAGRIRMLATAVIFHGPGSTFASNR